MIEILYIYIYMDGYDVARIKLNDDNVCTFDHPDSSVSFSIALFRLGIY